MEVSFFDVCFPSGPDTGFVVGDQGTFLRTTDGGTTWTRLVLPTDRNLRVVRFPENCQAGYVLPTPPDKIFRTTDGGATWVEFNTGIADSFRLLDMSCPADIRTAYISAGGWGDPERPGVYRTDDSGATWTFKKIDTQAFVPLAVHFVTIDTGYETGCRVYEGLPPVFRTCDGGNTWRDRTVGQGQSGFPLWDVSFPAGTAKGYVFGGGSAYRTSDGGVHWETIIDGGLFAGDDPSWIVFPAGMGTGYADGGNTNGYYAPGYARVLRTNDGGTTWSIQDSIGGEPVWLTREACFVTTQTGYIVGDRGLLLRTTDGGASAVAEQKIAHGSSAPVLKAVPNPLHSSTRLRFTLDAESYVRLSVYDAAGRPVVKLLDGLSPGGTHSVSWNCRDGTGQPMPAGVYFVRLVSAGQSATAKVVKLD